MLQCNVSVLLLLHRIRGKLNRIGCGWPNANESHRFHLDLLIKMDKTGSGVCSKAITFAASGMSR